MNHTQGSIFAQQLCTNADKIVQGSVHFVSGDAPLLSVRNPPLTAGTKRWITHYPLKFTLLPLPPSTDVPNLNLHPRFQRVQTYIAPCPICLLRLNLYSHHLTIFNLACKK